MSDHARLRWLCRRGTKELDLLLGRFLEAAYANEPPQVQRAFERLLECQDPELYALLSGRVHADDPEIVDVVERIRNCSPP